MKVWESGSRTAYCVQKGTVSLWHQQNQSYKVYSLELAPMAVKIKLSIYILLFIETQKPEVRNLLSMAAAKAGLKDWYDLVLRYSWAWDPRRFSSWRLRPQSRMVQPCKSSWPKHFATQPSGNTFCRCCGTCIFLWSYLYVSYEPLLLIFCTNRSCCLALEQTGL